MNDEQLLRYSRQLMLPQFEVAGQERLLAAKVLVIGLGGLGCPAALYLAAAGVGTLVLADFDTVELTNLQRQIAHGVADIGRSKVDSAADSIRRINPDIELITLNAKLDAESLCAQIEQVDLVLDCSDRFSTRFAVNAACVATQTPLVSGAAIRFDGQLLVIDPRQPDSPCYACLYEDMGDEELRCAENGVIAPLVGIIGTLQAMEAVKILSQLGTPAVGKLLTLDSLTLEWRTLRLRKDEQCCVCGHA